MNDLRSQGLREINCGGWSKFPLPSQMRLSSKHYDLENCMSVCGYVCIQCMVCICMPVGMYAMCGVCMCVCGYVCM